ncbi:hypothetical protein [Treponema pectinovorum]|uniref:hypothetical protein n=1 Tax=Treponema pectinovorum TaxID=164 RepID=UPI00164EB48C|nr:hypothetical protein [Treponema pectinovorum]
MSEKMISDSCTQASEWYSFSGKSGDVVLSTRVRLARNLADFPFPQKFRNDDAVRVQSLIFDAFLKSQKDDIYQTISVASLTPWGAKMLIERGLIKQSTLNSPGAGFVMRTNGKAPNSGLVCTINDEDHLRISCFVAGMDCDKAFYSAHEIDELLQNSLQFAASYDFGYLTANPKNSGSGMKITARLHLPSTAFLRNIGPLADDLRAKGIRIDSAFGNSVEHGGSLGSFYDLSSTNSGTGSEVEQLADFTGIIKSVIDAERKNRDIILQKHTTEITDRILKSFSHAKFALIFNLRDALSIVSDIKWGKNLSLIDGIEDSTLTALLYRIQEAHLGAVLKNGKFNFPIDIANDEKKQTARLRSLVMQDSFENLKICE